MTRPIKKDRESLDKLFINQTTDNRKNKILMIGEKRVTSDFSSSRSHEREIVQKNKNPLLMLNKNSARKVNKNNTISKELAKKYAGKFELGKVSLNNI